MSRTSTVRQHLQVVRPGAGKGDVRRIGPYELLREVDHLGLPGLWYAQREAPPYLAGPSLLLPIDRKLAQLPGVQERVVRAARRAQAVRHPLLVRVEEILATDDELALVLEAVDAVSLDVLLKSSDSLGIAFQADVLLELGARLLEALHDLHTLPHAEDTPTAHGHVSVKTVLFSPDGSLRLIGFGLPTATGSTPLHSDWNARMPTRADEKALDLPALGDQYAVGLLLLQLATGRSLTSQVPRESSVHERAAAVERMLRRLSLRGPLTPPLLRLLAPNPAHRFSDALAAAAALRHPRGPYAAEALEALIRGAGNDLRDQDGTEPEGTPVDLLPHRKAGAEPQHDTLRSDETGTDLPLPPSDWDISEDTEDAVPAVSPPVETVASGGGTLASAPAYPSGTVSSAPGGVDRPGLPPQDTERSAMDGAEDAEPASPPASAFEETSPSPGFAPAGPMDLSNTQGSDEAGMAVAVARAWAETDGSVPARRFDVSDLEAPILDDEDNRALDSRADDSLDVWTGHFHNPVSPGVEQDTGALSSEDLQEVAGDWFLDEDPSNIELARTEPEADSIEEGPDGRRRVKPGRTVPYSPAFVPKSTAFRRAEDPVPPELSPGAMGLLSAAMPAVMRDAPMLDRVVDTGSEEREARSTDPGTPTPLATARVQPRQDEDDKTHPFGGETPTAASVADVPAPSSQARSLEAPTSVPGEAPGGPAWVTPSEALDDNSVVRAAIVSAMTATGPMPLGGPLPGTLPGLPPAQPTPPPAPRKRRRRRNGARSRRGATTVARSLPRLWDQQTVWSSSPVARGIILGILILLMIGLVEGIRRRAEATNPEQVQAREEAERQEEALLK